MVGRHAGWETSSSKDLNTECEREKRAATSLSTQRLEGLHSSEVEGGRADDMLRAT